MARLTWKDVRPTVLALLSDKDVQGQTREYEDKDVITWWNNGQMQLAVLKPQTRHQIYKSDDGIAPSLPMLHYKPRAVYIPGSTEPLPRLQLEQAVITGRPGYCIYEDKITLNGFREIPQEWWYFYNSYFPKVVSTTSQVYAPEWSHEAIANYVGMQAMTLEAVEDARYRKFTTPVDATGNPTNNPFLKVAEFYKARFHDIINLHVDDDDDFR
jgi:hypothetical protein